MCQRNRSMEDRRDEGSRGKKIILLDNRPVGMLSPGPDPRVREGRTRNGLKRVSCAHGTGRFFPCSGDVYACCGGESVCAVVVCIFGLFPYNVQEERGLGSVTLKSTLPVSLLQGTQLYSLGHS